MTVIDIVVNDEIALVDVPTNDAIEVVEVITGAPGPPGANAATVVTLMVTDPNGSPVAVANGQAYYRIPAALNGHTIATVAAHVTTASSSGTPTVQVAKNGTDILSTRITIDASEKDSSTAAVPAVITPAQATVATADEIRVDVDVAGTGTKGLMVELTFT